MKKGNVPYFSEELKPAEFEWCEKLAHDIIDEAVIVRHEVNVAMIRTGLTLALKRGRYFNKKVLSRIIAIAVFMTSMIAFNLGYLVGIAKR